MFFLSLFSTATENHRHNKNHIVSGKEKKIKECEVKVKRIEGTERKDSVWKERKLVRKGKKKKRNFREENGKNSTRGPLGFALVLIQLSRILVTFSIAFTLFCYNSIIPRL